MTAQPAAPATRGSRGTQAELVGPALLVTDSADPIVRPLATASLLMAAHVASSSAGNHLDTWPSALVGSLTSMGWVTDSVGSESVHLPPAETFVPWTLVQPQLQTVLSAAQVAAVQDWGDVLLSAPPVIADRWRAITAMTADQFRSVVAVASSTATGPHLALAVTTLGYPSPPEPGVLPWGAWACSGASFGQAVTGLQIGSADGAALLAALTPKVAPVLETEVVGLHV